MLYGNIGSTLSCMGRYTESIAATNKAIQIFRKQGSLSNMYLYTMNRGDTHRKTGSYSKALEDLQLALDGFRDGQESSHLSLVWGNLAELYMRMKKYDLAEQALKPAIELSRNSYRTAHEFFKVSLAVVLTLQKRDSEVIKVMDSIDEKILSRNSKFHYCIILSRLGFILYNLSRVKEAKSHFTQAEELIAKYGYKPNSEAGIEFKHYSAGIQS